MSTVERRVVEQAQQYGIDSLSDADLLSLLLSKGTAAEREKIMRRVKALLTERGGLQSILSTDIAELFQYEFDEALATRLHGLLELSRRLARPMEKRFQVKCGIDAIRYVKPDLFYLDHEEMRVLVLDTKLHIVANVFLYKGTVNSSVIRTAEIFQPAIVRKCPNIIICHNHPSGDPAPSPEDREVTRQCVEAGKLLDIEVLDHLIIGNPNHVSLRENMLW